LNDSPCPGHYVVGGDCLKLGNLGLYTLENRGIDRIGNDHARNLGARGLQAFEGLHLLLP